MAGGIDTSNRKPRRLRGTPAVKFSNRFAAVILGFGVATGLLLNYSFPIVDDINKKFGFNLLVVSDEESDRRQLFSFTKPRSSAEVLRLLEQKEDLEKKY